MCDFACQGAVGLMSKVNTIHIKMELLFFMQKFHKCLFI